MYINKLLLKLCASKLIFFLIILIFLVKELFITTYIYLHKLKCYYGYFRLFTKKNQPYMVNVC